MLRPLHLNPCADFYAIAEGKNHPSVRMDRCIIHKPVEQLLIEIHRQLPHFLKSRNESVKNVILYFLPLPLFLQAIHPALKGGIAAGIPVILFAVVVLVKFPGGVLIDQLLDQPSGHLHLSADRLHLRVDGTAVRQGFHDRPAVTDDLLPFLHQDSGRRQEQLLDKAVFFSPRVSSSRSSYSIRSRSSLMSNGANLAPQLISMLLAVMPVATCQGHFHHFSSFFLGLPCFPCSKSWRMTRFNLSFTFWVLVSEKCTSTKYLVLSIFCCKQGVNRPVVLV